MQIRTTEMHTLAEYGVAAHWTYKQIGHPTVKREGQSYRWLRELLEILEHTAGPEEFLEHTKLEMYQDQVFCFTPKGDLIALPHQATPVDFAYSVHSAVGDHCVGAKINGRVAPLRTRLRNGDQVEILGSWSDKGMRWLEIDINGTKGWIDASELAVDQAKPIAEGEAEYFPWLKDLPEEQS